MSRLTRKFLLQVIAHVCVFGCCLFGRESQAENRGLSAGSHYAQLGDLRLHYVVAGRGPRVFVISPGWGIGSIYLQRGLVPLQTRLTLVFLDERGNGESSRPNDVAKMSTITMANDLEHLRKFLGLNSVDLLGHSQGGMIALDYAERYPEHVGKVALIDPEVMDDRARETTRSFLAARKDDPRYKTAVEALLHAPATVDDNTFAAVLSAILPLYFSDPERQVPIFMATIQGTHLSSFAQNNRALADVREPRKQSTEYGNIRATVLILNGGLD